MPTGGCHGDNEWVSGIVTPTCPVKWLIERGELFQAFQWIEKGIMPYAGGYMEQPAALMEAISIITPIIENYRKEHLNGNSKRN